MSYLKQSNPEHIESEVHSYCQRQHTIEQPCPKNITDVLQLKYMSVANLTEADLKFIRSNKDRILNAIADLM